MTVPLTSHVERSAIVLDHVFGTVGDVAALLDLFQHEVESAFDRGLTLQYLKT